MESRAYPHVLILGLEGGKADPYYTIRENYVSPNKDPSGRDLPKRIYEGKQAGAPVYKSEFVMKNLNPVWKTHALDLHSICGEKIDLEKKILIDVWDWDLGLTDDFIGYAEVTLQELIEASARGKPIVLKPPPEPHKQTVGHLVVRTALPRVPQVMYRVVKSRASKDAEVEFVNTTTIDLKVQLSSTLQLDLQLGSLVTNVDDKSLLHLTKDGGKIATKRPDNNKGTGVMILSKGNLLVGNFIIGSYVPGSKDGTYELFLNLDALDAANTFGGQDEPSETIVEDFELTLSLKLRGSNLPATDYTGPCKFTQFFFNSCLQNPIARVSCLVLENKKISSLYHEGKSDPFYEIRRAFGSGYEPPNCSGGTPLPPEGRTYRGKQTAKYFFKSDVVKNELDPVWKMHLLELNSLCLGDIDLQKKILIDVWDDDLASKGDFIGYVEVSLQELLDLAQSGRALDLIPPPPAKGAAGVPVPTNAGKIYVEQAVLGFPQVLLKVTPNKGEGIYCSNQTDVTLKVLVAKNKAEFDKLEVGRFLEKGSQENMSFERIKANSSKKIEMHSGEEYGYVVFLNVGNLVVAKRSVATSARSCLELTMNLEAGIQAISQAQLALQIESNYKDAVKETSACLEERGSFTVDHIQKYKQRMQEAEKLLDLAPKFNMKLQDAHGRMSYTSFLSRQADVLEQTIMRCELSGSDQQSIELACSLADKLKLLCDHFKDIEDPDCYKNIQQMVYQKVYSSVEDGEVALKEHRFDYVASNLTDIKVASKTRIAEHFPKDKKSLANMLTELLTKAKAFLQGLRDVTQIRLKSITEAKAIAKEADVEQFLIAGQSLIKAQNSNWENHLEEGYLASLAESFRDAIKSYIQNLFEQWLECTKTLNMEQAKFVFEGLKALHGLGDMDASLETLISAYSNKFAEQADKALAEQKLRIESMMSAASTFATGNTASHGEAPNISEVAKIINTMNDSQWLEEVGVSSFRRSLEMAQSVTLQKVNATLQYFRGASLDSGSGIAPSMVYFVDCCELLSCTKSALLAPIDAAKVELCGLLEGLVQKLSTQLKAAIQSYTAQQSSANKCDLSGEFKDWDKILDHCTEFSKSLHQRRDMVQLYTQVEGFKQEFEAFMQTVIADIKSVLANCLSGIQEKQNIWDVNNVDDLQKYIRNAIALKKHQSLFRLCKSEDFVDATIIRTINMHEGLSKKLLSCMCEHDTSTAEKLLKLVQSLRPVDEVSGESTKSFNHLYDTYNNLLNDSLHNEERTIINQIATSSLVEAANNVGSRYKVEEVPLKVKNELSKKILEAISSLEKKIRALPRDLPSEQMKSIADDWEMLEALGKGAIDYANDNVKREYNQLMRTDADKGVTSQQAGAVQKTFKSLLAQKIKNFENDFRSAVAAGMFQKAMDIITRLDDVSGFEMIFGVNLTESIHQFNQNLSTAVDEKIANIKRLQVEDYLQNPPSDFFALFTPADATQILELPNRTDVATKFKTQIEAVWKDIEAKITDRIQKADLGRGSTDLAVLENAIQALPESQRKKALQKHLTDQQKIAVERKSQLDTAMSASDADAIVKLIQESQPCIQAEYVNQVSTYVKKIKDDLCNNFERHPCEVRFEENFFKQWQFVVSLKIADGLPTTLSTALGRHFEELKGGFSRVEYDAKESMLSLMNTTGRKVAVDGRFPDAESTFAFLEAITSLKCTIGHKPAGREILPDNLGTGVREVCRSLLDDCKNQLKQLDSLFQADPAEKPFDMTQIILVLKQLKSRSDLSMRALAALRRFDNPEDVMYQSAASSQTISENVKAFIVQNYQDVPDLTKKIALSSERLRAFQLMSKRVAAEPLLPGLQEFVGGDQVVNAILVERFSSKALKAISKVAAEIRSLCSSLPPSLVLSMFQQQGYSAKADGELESVRRTCEQINMMHDHIELFQQHVCPVLTDRFEFDIQMFGSDLLQKASALADRAFEDAAMDCMAGVLIYLQVQKQELLFQSADIKKLVEECLERFQSSEAGKGSGISKLGLALASTKFRPYGEQMTQTYDAFQGYRAKVFREKTGQFKEDYVLKNMALNSGAVNQDRLLQLFREYDAEYKAIIEQCLKDDFAESAGQSVVKKLRDQVQAVGVQHEANCTDIKWSKRMRDAVPTMVARIFAIWTIHHSKRFLKAVDSADKASYLFMPHPVQVIAIFCMLGIDSDSSDMKVQRSLVQVRTGEGKTAVLGVAACVFALFKVQVNCACYSEYLSTRDYKSLDFLFKALDVQAYVAYCTLVKLCEREINKKVNIRERVAAAILGEGGAKSPAQTPAAAAGVEGCPRVLLVDEVDVFFTKDFYGSTYNPACELRHESIAELLQTLWDRGQQQHDALDLKEVKTWPQYRAVADAFRGWEALVEAAASQMLEDLRGFASHAYEVFGDRIGYREQDGIAFNVSYRYMTVFAHLKEGRSGKISDQEMRRNLKLLVQCGRFWFAKLPCDFQLVLGVTGTLKTLTDAERDIVCQDYKVRRFIYMPSVYGDRNAVKLLGVATCDTPDAMRAALVREIEAYTADRAAIVIFETKDHLTRFWNSPEFQAAAGGGGGGANRVHVLLEESREDEKQQIISCRTGAARAITLATRSFGRGTDFAALDDAVNQAGGIHVIQTFLPETESEEIQIRGRTARQGERGSFSMVLLREPLVQTFGIELGALERAEAQGVDKVETLLNAQRRGLSEARCRELVDTVRREQGSHDKAMDFVHSLAAAAAAGGGAAGGAHLAKVREFVMSQNRFDPAGGGARSKARILVLMDATGSMDKAMRAAKDTISVIFDRATQILSEFSLGGGGGTAAGGEALFEMQFAVYRNYSSGPEKLLECSEWRADPGALKAFLQSVAASGGQGNEAIEVGLWHANNQPNLKQVILIGDARANTREEVDTRRGASKIWSKSRFGEAVYYQSEVKKLAEAGIMVDTFFIRRDPAGQENFAEIARETKGDAYVVDICTPDGGQRLINAVAPRILLHVGGAKDGSAMVDKYKETFKMFS